VASVDHRMVWRRARPGRAAICIPSPGGDWIQIAKSALCSLSLTWGGVGDILVPIGADSQPSPAFRAVLRAHDPDYVAAYEATLGEIALADPGIYASWRAARAGTGDGGEEEAALRQQFEAEMTGRPGSWDASAAVEFTRTWCSPYPSEHGYLPQSRSTAPLGRPLIPLSAFPGLLDRPLDLDLGAFDPAFELMVRMRIGSLAGAELPSDAALQFCTAEERDRTALSELACTKEVSHPPALDSNVRHLAELHSPAIPPTINVDPLSPLRRTTHGMKWISFEVRATWVVVIGDSCADFCLALACDRLLLGSTWIPARLINDPLLIDGLLALRNLIGNNATYGHQAVFTSMSLDAAEVDQARQAVLTMDAGAADRCSRVIPPTPLVFGRPKRLADPGSLVLGESSTCYHDEAGALSIATALATPIPDVARNAQPSEVAWEVDVSVEREQPLPRSALTPVDLLSSFPTSDVVDVRASTAGLGYHSHKGGAYLAGWILEQHLVRPVLRVPSASMTIRRLAQAAGYTVRPSQTGRLNQLVIDTWGGLQAAAADLAGPVRALLDVLTPSSDMTDGPKPTSLVINRLPYLTIEHARNLLGLDEAGTRAELDRLLGLRILRRGLILRCARCNWLDWYAIDQIGQFFRCGRCDQDNLLEQARWRDPVSEPQWYYDLDHAVREALKLDGHVPILALDRLRAQHRDGFSFTTDFELIKDGSTGHPPELDFAVIADGRLILGEAKKNDRLASQRREERRKLNRLCGAARDLTADDVCLATAADAWDHGTVELADQALSDLEIGRIYQEGLGPRFSGL